MTRQSSRCEKQIFLKIVISQILISQLCSCYDTSLDDVQGTFCAAPHAPLIANGFTKVVNLRVNAFA